MPISETHTKYAVPTNKEKRWDTSGMSRRKTKIYNSGMRGLSRMQTTKTKGMESKNERRAKTRTECIFPDINNYEDALTLAKTLPNFENIDIVEITPLSYPKYFSLSFKVS